MTGKYWLYSDNDDSTIPELFMSKIVSKIQDVIIENSVCPPKSFTGIVGERIFDAKKMFVQAGFNKVKVKSSKKPFYSIFAKKGSVYKVSINGIENFNEGSMFDPESEVCIYFYYESNDIHCYWTFSVLIDCLVCEIQKNIMGNLKFISCEKTK